MPEEMNVVYLLKEPPHGSLHPVEGLRMAVATEDLEPLVIAIGDGVYTYIKGADKTIYQMHIDFLHEIDIEMWVDKKSLEERGLTKDDLIDQVIIKEHDQVLKSILGANTVIPL